MLSTMNRWLSAAFALAAGATGAGCGAANDQVIAIVGATVFNPDSAGKCVDPTAMPMMGMNCSLNITTPVISYGVYDVGIASTNGEDFNLLPVVTNRAMMRQVAQIDLNTVFLVAYDVELALNPKLAVSAAIPSSVLKRTVPIASPLLGTNCTTYLYTKVPVIDHGVAQAVFEAGVLNPGPRTFEVPPQVVTVRLRYRYNQSGVLGVSNWFEFPVEFCQWCLALDANDPRLPAFKTDKMDLATCPPPPSPPAMPVSFGDPCANGLAQDSKSVCCKKDRSYFCGSRIPTM